MQRQLKYLSPTALIEYETNPSYFFMTRLFGTPMERTAQADYFALGSAVDCFIKVWLAHKLGQTLPPTMMEDQVEQQWRVPHSQVMRTAMYLWAAYYDSPAIPYLVEAGLARVEDDVSPRFICDPRTPDRDPVPIFGKPDASLQHENELIVLDWKTTSTGKDPVGYKKLWARSDRGVWLDKGPHPRHMDYLENLNEKWAMQLATYAWLLGHPICAPMTAMIHQLILDGSEVRIAMIHSPISVLFQEKLIERYHKCWEWSLEQKPPEDLEFAKLMVD